MFTSPPPSTTVARYGSTTSPRPSSCITTITSTIDPPKPPCASANGTPRRPISASCAQTASLQPLSEAMIFLRSSKPYSFATKRAIESRSRSCSSLSVKSIVYNPRTICAMMLRWISFDPP